jgi:hypothetical protein
LGGTKGLSDRFLPLLICFTHNHLSARPQGYGDLAPRAAAVYLVELLHDADP